MDRMIATEATGGSWYVLHTHPGCEYRVRRWLEPAQSPVLGSSPEIRRAVFASRPGRVVIDPLVAYDFRSKLNLERQGYELWLPECVVIRSTRNKREISRRLPWFPGYLFVRLDLARGWRQFEEVEGVAGFLGGASGAPAPVDDERIAGLKAACDPGTGVATIEVKPRDYEDGQEFRVLSGPFTDFSAFFRERDGDRIKAFLTLFNQPILVSFDEAQLEAVS